ncbi:MAG: Gfo/Idh/MocA family oxidoreductase [Clostridia bacterium]|nr:Gfo/Idh/MocA family oxidoreductase [Clostridia bacterium]
MKPLKIALIGAGPMGLSMALNLQKTGRADLVAICDHSADVLQNACQTFVKQTGQEVAAFSSYDELTKKGKYDGVMIALSPETQPKLAVSEMKRGKHVLCQVPVAVTMEDCHALMDAARESGVVFVGAEQAHCWQFVEEWRKLMAQGELGHIIFAEGEYLHYEPKWDWFVDENSGKPIITDDASLGKEEGYRESWRHRVFKHPILYLPHTLNPLLTVTGGRITKVSCFGTKPESYSSEGFMVRDLETAVMYNDKDTVFVVKTGFTTPHGFKAGTGAHWYQLKGTKATVEWARSEIDTPKRFDAATKEWTAENWGVPPKSDDPLVQESGHGGVDLFPILAFLDGIQKGIKPRMDALACVELAAPAIAAAQSSEQGGKLIEVPSFR